MDYSSMTLSELREVARSKEVKSITTLKKAELIEILQSMESAPKEKTKTVATKSMSEKEANEKVSAEKTPVEKNSKEKTSVDKGNGERAKGTDGKNGNRIVQRFDSRTSENHTTFGERRVNKTNVRVENRQSQERVISQTESKQPEVMRFESRPAVRNEGAGDMKGIRTEVQEPQVYDAENRQERANDDKKILNIRNEAFTMEEFLKQDNPEILALDSGNEVNGILEIMEGYGFIRSANYLPGENDVYVSPAQIRRFNLKTGDILKGNTRVKTQAEKFSALLFITSVNGFHPLEAQKRRPFEELTPIFPDEKIRLEQPGSGIPMRIVDVIAPIGKGQRGMIVSPPKAGKTTLLKQIAKTISRSYKDMHMLVLLIDERPEEVTDIRESIEGPNVEVIYSTFDELPEHHKRVAEMVLDRAKRLVEHKKDVVILLDSITRLARAYNLIVPPSGRTLTGGLDPAALYMPKKFFGAARNIREGGSLTILATALVETGSKMDDVVFEEFKGTGNMELVLDRKLSEKRIFPALDISKSSTRRDDLLLTKEEQEAMYLVRREISGAKSEEAIEEVLKLFVRTKNNEEFLNLVQKSLGRR